MKLIHLMAMEHISTLLPTASIYAFPLESTESYTGSFCGMNLSSSTSCIYNISGPEFYFYNTCLIEDKPFDAYDFSAFIPAGSITYSSTGSATVLVRYIAALYVEQDHSFSYDENYLTRSLR